MASRKKLLIIETPTNLGLKTPDSGTVPGVDRLPDWFRAHGLHQRLGLSVRVVRVAAPAYTGELDSRSGIRQADAMAAYAQKVAKEVTAAIDQHTFALVLGGDYSVLTGCCLDLPSAAPYGLFFLDGPTDFAWPGLSQTGGAAGMDLALVTGHGPEKLTNLNGRKPYIAEADAWSVGNRDDDPAYVAAIESSGIQYESGSITPGRHHRLCTFVLRAGRRSAAGRFLDSP